MSETKTFKAAFPLEGESHVFQCTAIEFEGRIWLVPNWLSSPDGKYTMPERIILLEQFQHQRLDPPGPTGENFVVNVPIPKALFEGRVSHELKEKYVVIERPDIKFQMGGNTIH
jgi:hypothetical protein